jgi:hypothetical protein
MHRLKIDILCVHVTQFSQDFMQITNGVSTCSVYTQQTSSSSSSFTGFYNPFAGFSLITFEVSRSHTMTHHSR